MILEKDTDSDIFSDSDDISDDICLENNDAVFINMLNSNNQFATGDCITRNEFKHSLLIDIFLNPPIYQPCY